MASLTPYSAAGITGPPWMTAAGVRPAPSSSMRKNLAVTAGNANVRIAAIDDRRQALANARGDGVEDHVARDVVRRVGVRLFFHPADELGLGLCSRESGQLLETAAFLADHFIELLLFFLDRLLFPA